jgi:hypothetical protein
MNVTDEGLFYAAANRWQSIITGDLPSVPKSQIQTLPMAGCTYPDVIDDLYICAKVGNIDGVGNIASQARPTWMRLVPAADGGPTGTRNGLPVAGEMIVDNADIGAVRAAGLFEDLILHEMAHVIGINSGTFADRGVQNLTAPGCPYTGALANAEYHALTGCASVPMEQTGGAGTRCKYVHFSPFGLYVSTMCDGAAGKFSIAMHRYESHNRSETIYLQHLHRPSPFLHRHWSEACMITELMTPQLNFGANPISRVSVRCLLRWEVFPAWQNCFTFPSDFFSCLRLFPRDVDRVFIKIASLEDIGFQVDYSMADSYGTAQIAPSCLCNQRRSNLRDLVQVRLLDPANTTAQLRPELQEYAIAYGQAQLKEAERTPPPMSDGIRDDDPFSSVLFPDQVVYIGDRFISVIVEQDGHYYSVLVVNDSYV